MKEYKVYTIQEGDTLKSIADRLQIKVEDLITFHNAHSNFLLVDDAAGLSALREIFIPSDLESFRRQHTSNRCPLYYGSVDLSCENIIVEESTEMVLKKQKMVQTCIVRRYSVKQEETDGYAICIVDAGDFIKRQISPIYKPLAETVSFLGRPLDHLVLGINPDGSIVKVVNQKEVAEQWQSLKQTEEARALLMDKTIGENVEHAMDADYSQTLNVINETLRYRLLCPDFFGEHFLSERKKRQTTLQLTSNFFTSKKISFDLEERCECSQDKETLYIMQRYQAKHEMQEELSVLYNSTIRDYLQIPLAYNMEINCKFTIPLYNMQIQEVECAVNESLNELSSYINNIHIIYHHE